MVGGALLLGWVEGVRSRRQRGGPEHVAVPISLGIATKVPDALEKARGWRNAQGHGTQQHSCFSRCIITVRSPRKSFIFSMYKSTFWIKVSKKYDF